MYILTVLSTTARFGNAGHSGASIPVDSVGTFLYFFLRT